MMVAIRKHNRLARLVGRGWYHLDLYGASAAPDVKAHHMARALEAIAQFASQTPGMTCSGEPVKTSPSATAPGKAGEGEAARFREATALLLACAERLRADRPGIVRHLVLLLLMGACALGLAAYAIPTLSILRSNEGLQVSYFRGKQFDKKAMTWTERRVLKDYGTGRPCLFCPAEGFSARWEGLLVAPKDADYSFYAQSIGGLRLMIDDAVVIDDWNEHEWVPGKPGTMRLTTGAHRIRIEYFHARGPAALRVRWCGGGIPPDTVLGGKHLKKR